jgi:tetratricopeptide (TPR) repeat protein
MSTNETYLTLFHDYIQSGLQQSLERVRAAEPLVTEPDRQQAWHLLSYAFGAETGWLSTRELLLELAPKMEQAGYREEWIPYLEQGIQQSQKVGDGIAEIEFKSQIGILYRLQNKFDFAHQWLTASAERSVELGETQRQACALNQLAYVACLRYSYIEASHLAKTALDLLVTDDPERAMSYFVLGMVAINCECWQEAEDYHRRSLKLREKQFDKRKIAWSLQNLGFALYGQQRFEEATVCYEQAIGISDEIQDPLNQAIMLMNLGNIYLQTRRFETALNHYAKAEAKF